MAKTATFKKRTATFTKREATTQTATFTKRDSEKTASPSRDTPVSVYDPNNAAKKSVEMTFGEYEDMQKTARQQVIDSFVKVPTTAKGKLDQRYTTNVMQQQNAYEELAKNNRISQHTVHEKNSLSGDDKELFELRTYDFEANGKKRDELKAVKDAAYSEMQSAMAKMGDPNTRRSDPTLPADVENYQSKMSAYIAAKDAYDKFSSEYVAKQYKLEKAEAKSNQKYALSLNTGEIDALIADFTARAQKENDAYTKAESAWKSASGTAVDRSQYEDWFSYGQAVNDAYDTSVKNSDALFADYEDAKKAKTDSDAQIYYLNGLKSFSTLSAQERNDLLSYVSMHDDDGVLNAAYIAGVNAQNADAAYKSVQKSMAKEDFSRMIETLFAMKNATASAENNLANAKFANEHPVASSVVSVFTSLFGGIAATGEIAGTAVGNIGKEEAYKKPIDVNAQAFALNDATNTVRGTVSDKIEYEIGGTGGKIASFLYKTGMSAADSFAASFTGDLGGALLLGSGAATNAFADAKERGASDSQAIWTGLFAGTFETLFEKVSIGNLNALKETPVASIKDILKNVAKSAGVNAWEEGMTEAANIVSDYLINLDDSTVMQTYNAYVENGMSESEAWKQTMCDSLKQIGLASLSGAIMGAGMSSVVGTANYVRNSLSEDGRAAFDIAMEGATDKEATARQFKIKYLEGETGAEFTVDEDGELTPSMQEAAYKYGAEAAKAEETEKATSKVREHFSADGKKAFDAALESASDKITAAKHFDAAYLNGFEGKAFEVDNKSALSPVDQKKAYNAGKAAKASLGTVTVAEGVNVSNKFVRDAEKVAKELGAHIVIDAKGAVENGKQDRGSLTKYSELHISADAEVDVYKNGKYSHTLKGEEAAMMIILGHEVTHRLKQLDEASYNRFKKFVLGRYGDRVEKYMSERGYSREVAEEEVVCDYAMQMLFTDESVIQEVTKKHSKVAEAFRDFLAWIKAKLNIKSSQIDTAIRLWNDAYNASMRNAKSGANIDAVAKQSLSQNGVDIVEGSAVKHSVTSWTEQEQARVENALIKSGFDQKQAQEWIEDVNSVAAIILEDAARLDYIANPDEKFMKPNHEYKYTLDASTLCDKRILFQGTFNEIQHRLKDGVLLSDDLIRLENMLKEFGYKSPCAVCYVESRRRHLGAFAERWLAEYDGAYKPHMDELTTTDGNARLKSEHPQTYEDFMAAMRKLGSANPKIVETRTDYRGDVGKLTKPTVNALNKAGGLRIQSFSDFETPHLIDMMQAVMDMTAKGLASQAYTKVPNFAWVFGDTGIKINLSLIAEGNGFDANGNLIFSSTEGMDIDEAMALRDAYSKNVGTIIVGANKEHILACMADDRIDYIIPFHKSGWGAKELEALGLKDYDDFTDWQNERSIATGSNAGGNMSPLEYWDFSKSGKENAEAYLAICAERGLIPKFNNFLVDNGDGTYSLQPDGSTDGYWKTLIDFKMYDNDGNGSPQTLVQPTFNMDEAVRVLNEYEGGANSLPVAYDVADAFVKEFNAKSGDVAHSTGGTEDILFAEEKNTADGDVKWSKESAATKIASGMSDTDRTAVLKNKSIAAPIYNGEADAAVEANREDLQKKYGSFAEDAMRRVAAEFEMFESGTEKYRISDLDIEVAFSKGSLDESTHKKVTDVTQLAKLLPKLRDAVENAVGVEAHNNRYFADFNTKEFYELVGGYFDGDYFVPVRFGVKAFADKTYSLYIVVCQDRIEKTKVMKPSDAHKAMKNGSRLVTISIPHLFENVNTPDLLRYIPDDFLNEMQKESKYKAIADTIRYTNDKNDSAYKKAIERGDRITAQRIVEAAAKAWGAYSVRGNPKAYYHGTKSEFTVFDKSKLKDSLGFFFTENIDEAKEYGIPNRFFLKSGKAIDLFGDDFSKYNKKRGEELSEALAADGYDSIYSYSHGVEWLIVFNPMQIKSAETITYDDNGKVIPISQRFNTDSPDIRYSTTGTEDILFESEADKARYVADSFDLSGAENYKAAGSMERMSGIANSIAKAHRVNKDGRTKLAKALEKGVQNMRKAAKSDDVKVKQTAAEGFLEAAMVISPDADVQAQVEIANALAESVWAEMTTDRLPDTIRSIRDDAIKAARAEVRADRLAALGEKYGIIKPGERPSRVVTLPKKTSEGKKVSQTVRTVMEAEATPDDMIPTLEQMVTDGEFSYETITDKGAVAKAEDRITKNGFDATVREWFKAVGSGKVSKDNTALGWTIYNNAANSGDTELAVEVLCEMVKHQRNAAQALQATRILKKLSPSGQLYAAQKSVQGLQEELEERYGDKAPELKIDPKLAEEVLNADTEEKCEKALADLYRDIGRQIPSSVMDKWNAWRYLSMLGNARTHIRNIVGNAGFAPVVTAKNVVATGIESLVGFVSRGKVGRTKAFLTPTKSDRALLAAAWSDYDAVADAALGQSKYNDNQYANKYIEEGKRVFKFKPLEAARRGNSWLLDKEDSWFSKPQYANALAQYCKANGITSEQIQSGKDLDKARAYAIKEAQKATYRDTNAFSELFSKLGRIDERGEFKTAKRIWNRGVEGVLPFRKTPANILARGIEYSPLGLVSVIRDLSRIKSGETTAAEAIDKAAATLTGTGLMALGAFLVTQGVLRGFGGDDDKEKEFEELMGHQQYALEIGGTSVTLDWLAPEALPFFVGANIAEQCMQDGEMTLEGFISALGSISDPMLSMSCLQGLNDLIESVSFSDTSGIVTIAASAATSYLTQGIPTLFGQIERTSESERMMTYTSKGNKMLTPDMQYTVGKVSAKLPGDYSQIPYIDAWGRTESSGSVGERAFNNFANPAYTSNISESDMEKELLRLYKQTGESVLPSRADKSFPIDGEEVYLTAEQYQKYATSKGKRSHRILTALTHSDTYNSLDDFTKAEIVSKVYSYCNAIAKSGCGAKNNAGKGYALDGWVSKAYDACSKYGIDEATYIAAYIMAGNAGKYVNGGETIDNSPGLCIMQAVYSIPGLSQEQYDAMFVNFGVGSKVRGYDKKTVESKIAEFNKKYERIEG